jgi:integrase
MNLTKTTYTENSLALGTKAQDILSNAKSENTRKAYKTDVQKYLAWASTKDYTSEVVMIEYFTYLLNEGYKYSSIKRAKVALTSACSIQVTKITKEFIKGASKTKFEAKPVSSKKETTAININTLRNAVDMIARDKTKTSIRDKALILLGFVGAFRAKELTGLKWQDIKFVPSGLEISLYGTKTTAINEGKELKVIPKSTSKNGLYCAVKAIKELQKESEDNEYVFLSASNNAKHKPISKVGFWNIVKKYCGSEFSPHSLRAGLITTAYKNGSNIKDIMTRTGHKDTNTALGYVKNTDYWNAEINIGL